MPPKPRWHADLKQIRSAALKLDAPFLDRQAVEKLFGLRARQANNLMKRLGGYRIGLSVVVGREDLLARLDQLALPRDVASESRRKARVLEELNGLRNHARPRRVTPPPARAAGASLPAGVRIAAPGEMTILFSSPEDLLGRILGLAQSAAGDFAAFAAGLEAEPGPEPEGVADALPEPLAGLEAVGSPEES